LNTRDRTELVGRGGYRPFLLANRLISDCTAGLSERSWPSLAGTGRAATATPALEWLS
jgi:hypothetical protein